MMQNPKQQGIARICSGLARENKQKKFSDGCDGRPNYTIACDCIANVGAGPQEIEQDSLRISIVKIYDEGEKVALHAHLICIFTSYKNRNKRF